MKLTRDGLIRINFRDYLPHEKRRLRCNFKCSYCIQQDVEQLEFSEKEFSSSKKVWDTLASIEDTILVRLNFDGEILIDPWAREIWHYINSIANVKVCEIITNNSIDPKYYLARVDVAKASFNCSFHPECMSLHRFIGHCRTLKKSGCPVFATMVVKPDMVSEVAGIAECFKRSGIPFKPLLLLQNSKPAGRLRKYMKKVFGDICAPRIYRRRDERTIRKLYYSDLEFQFQNGRITKGMPCYAGVDMINVFINGSVYRCFRDRMGSVDELCDGTLVLEKEPYPCCARTCQCPAHMIFLKEFRGRYTLSDVFVDQYELGWPA